jgi:acetolactate synthase I/II/III large subunit
MITGGELLVELLEAQRVDRIFCSPGTEWAPVWEALAKRKAFGNNNITYINCRHEMLAVSAATGYGGHSGKLPAVLLHTGVGALHASMALRNAHFAKIPMIVFSGETYEHSPDGDVKAPGPHWLEFLSDVGGPSSLIRNCVKWSNSVKSRDSLVDLVYRGCRVARAMPQGPVFISVPVDILVRSYDECVVPAPCREDVAFSPSAGCLEEAATLLAGSTNPVVISEYAGKSAGAVERLVELSEMLAIPVFNGTHPITFNFPRHHPHYQGFDTAPALAVADVVLVAGGAAPWYPPSRCSPAAKVIVIDDDPLHENLPHWGYPVDIILAGKIERVLGSLVELLRRKRSGQEAPLVEKSRLLAKHHEERAGRSERAAYAEREAVPLSPRWFFHEAARILPDNTVILDETITHRRTIMKYMADPGRYSKSGHGGLGVGMGEAVGVKMARPDSPVVLIIGDGAFNYNPAIAALGLAQEYRLPILILLMNNGGYSAMKRVHAMLYPDGHAVSNDDHLGVAIEPSPDYVAVVSAFGGYGEKLERPEEIEPVLVRALAELARGKTVLVDVMCT